MTLCGQILIYLVGAHRVAAVDVMRGALRPAIQSQSQSRLMVMDVRFVEFTKYAANAMLATKI